MRTMRLLSGVIGRTPRRAGAVFVDHVRSGADSENICSFVSSSSKISSGADAIGLRITGNVHLLDVKIKLRKSQPADLKFASLPEEEYF